MDAKSHQWRINQREYARQEGRRGRRHAYEQLDPRRTALVVVDMVSFFVDDQPYCRGIVPNINALAHSLRSTGGVVAWVLPEHRAEPSAWEVGFYGADVAATYARSGGEGMPADRLWPGLESEQVDVWAEKSSASAFFPGRSSLPDQLSATGVDTVLIAGTVTNVCCESSARDASTLGHRVIVVADATAAVDDEWHNASLDTIYRSFGDVRPTAEVLELITGG